MIKLVSLFLGLTFSSVALSNKLAIFSFEKSLGGYHEFAKELLLDLTSKEATLVKTGDKICVGDFKKKRIPGGKFFRFSFSFNEKNHSNEGCQNNDFSLITSHLSNKNFVKKGKIFPVNIKNVILLSRWGKAQRFFLKRVG